MTRAIAAALCGLVLTVSTGGAQQPPSRPADAATATAVRKLLAATGATKLMINNLESMITSQRQNNPQVPAAFWDAFLAHARRDTTRLVDLLVPIYAAHLTQSELEELLRFYNSSIGQRLTAVQPDIFKESMAAGESWGELIARTVSDSLQQSQGKAPPNR
jgi:uncharacterized protein